MANASKLKVNGQTLDLIDSVARANADAALETSALLRSQSIESGR